MVENIKPWLWVMVRLGVVLHRIWKYEELHGKWVEFRFNLLTEHGLAPCSGVGKFYVIPHSFDDTKLAIRIVINLPEGHGRREIVFDLWQPLVDSIKRHPQPTVADFRCFQS